MSFSVAIQCKGCLLIRLLARSNCLLSTPLCSSVAKVVIDALQRKTNPNVQSEVRGCGRFVVALVIKPGLELV